MASYRQHTSGSRRVKRHPVKNAVQKHDAGLPCQLQLYQLVQLSVK